MLLNPLGALHLIKAELVIAKAVGFSLFCFSDIALLFKCKRRLLKVNVLYDHRKPVKIA